MTKNEWATEVEAALVSVASNWRVYKVWVEQTSPMLYAEITTASIGAAKHITLARDRFCPWRLAPRRFCDRCTAMRR
jgi:hypothetical protein